MGMNSTLRKVIYMIQLNVAGRNVLPCKELPTGLNIWDAKRIYVATSSEKTDNLKQIFGYENCPNKSNPRRKIRFVRFESAFQFKNAHIESDNDGKGKAKWEGTLEAYGEIAAQDC